MDTFNSTLPVGRKLRNRSQRHQLARETLEFIVQNRNKYPSKEALQAAAIAHLQSGQQISPDSDYPQGFILSFVLTSALSWLVGKLIDWGWDNITTED